MNKWWIYVCKIFAFTAIFILILHGVNNCLLPYWSDWNNYATTEGFKKEPRNTVEVLFVGSSFAVNAISPTQLYRDHGICAFTLATEQQPMAASYYMIKDAYRRHKKSLDTVVIDVSMVTQENRDIEFYQKALGRMDFSPVKLEAAFGVADGDVGKALLLLLPVYSYHDRWTELTKENFSSDDPVNGTRGLNAEETMNTSAVDYKNSDELFFRTDSNATPCDLNEKSMEEFDKIVDFCKEKDIELILTAFPRMTIYDKSLANRNMADEYGLTYLDFTYELNGELEFSYLLDTQDIGHLNFYGSRKLTDWFGRYLVENTDINDVRGKDGFEHMDEQLEKYHEDYEIPADLHGAPDVTEYIRLAIAENKTVLISVQGDAVQALTDWQRDYFAEAGLKGLAGITADEDYAAVIENGTVTWEEKAARSGEAYEGILLEEFLSSGESFSISSSDKSAAIYVDSIECIEAENGINVVVYDQDRKKTVDSAVFRTESEAVRSTYGYSTMKFLRETEHRDTYLENETYREIFAFLRRLDAAEAGDLYEDDELLVCIEENLKDEDNIIILAARDEASNKLSEDIDEAMDEMGLSELSQLGYREPYIGIISADGVVEDMSGETKDILEFQYENIYVKSAGFDVNGGEVAISIDGVNYSFNKRGLNLVVYNTREDMIKAYDFFDTHAVAQLVP